SDYGVNWKVDSTMTDVNSISQLQITSDNRIFAGHYKGKISANKMLLTSIDDKINNIITGYSINQNYPNPFNPTTTIEYIIPEESFVTLTVYNVLGKKVATLVNKIQKSGNYKINFDAANLASGVYFYKIKAGSYSDTKRMLLIK
ncbi:MAG: T9SS type A sorting domain-containing protein, partial [Rhodothermaceae bacterium]